MIRSVTVVNASGEALKITLNNPEPKHGLLITNIDGLGPAKAKVNVTERATTDGSIYNSARLETRNIVISLRFTFAPTIEDVRQLTYRYFPIKKYITLFFETDNRTVYSTGYVETNEPSIFSKDEGAQISIICPDPYFYDAVSRNNQTQFSGVEALFHFPFNNTHEVEITSSDPETYGERTKVTKQPMVMGNIFTLTQATIEYNGDSDVGVVFTLHALGTVKNVSLYNIDTRGYMFIDTEKLEQLTGKGFIAGDDIIVNTNTGYKSVTLLRDGHEINILNCVNRNADWFRLVKGDNRIAFSAEEGNEKIVMTAYNDIIYEGI